MEEAQDAQDVDMKDNEEKEGEGDMQSEPGDASHDGEKQSAEEARATAESEAATTGMGNLNSPFFQGAVVQAIAKAKAENCIVVVSLQGKLSY